MNDTNKTDDTHETDDSYETDDTNETECTNKMDNTNEPDDLMDFFDLTKDLKRIPIASGQTQGCPDIKDEDMFPDPTERGRPSKGMSYVDKYVARDNLLQQQVAQNEVSAPTACGLGDVDDQTSIGGSMAHVQEHFLKAEDTMRVFSQYDFTKKMKVTLPITSSKSKIMKVVDCAQTSIIQGKTGCGKSTQVPQFILDSCREKSLPCNIIVTQPRRIAAISLAKRVSVERNWPLGSLVGYQVGLDHEHKSEDTRLTYCTTGVLLQMVVAEKTLTKFSHIILDEVHERSKDMDFLIIVIKRLLFLNSKNVKVILMSATIDVRHFSQYFLTPMGSNMEFHPAPIIDLVTVDNPFPIEIFYLCSLTTIITRMPDVRYDEPGISLVGYQVAMKLIKSFDRLEETGKTKQRGAVLVFLPGIHEIEELYNMLMASEAEFKWWVKPLHSTITTSEQELVFKRPPEGYRKIILSTNIAESSITVPDITFVLDFVLTKYLVCDSSTNFQSLQIGWASKSNCTQRSGRAGRVAAGRVFRLVPKDFYEGLPTDNIPEMQRGSLEQVVLLTKLLDMGPPKAILALALDPPDLTRIEQTILTLKEKGALLRTSNRRESMSDGDITLLGRIMAALPVDPIISKLIMLGHVFSVLRECVIMGAAMSLKSVFSSPFQEKLKAYHSKLTWADSSCSDCIAFLNAYTVWEKNKEIGYYKRSVGGGEAEWAQRYHIQLQTMHEVHQLVQDLQQRLYKLNITIPVAEGRVQLTNVERSLVLKIVLAGAFYPNYYVRGSVGGQVNEREAVKVLDGRDPFVTVYLVGFPTDQPRRLYSKKIKDALEDCCPEIQVSFDSSSKVYVEFGQHQYPGMVMHNRKYVPTIPGKVSMGVYRAVKFRQLGIPISLSFLKPEDAKKRADTLGLPTSEAELLLSLKSAQKKDIKEEVEEVVEGIAEKIPLPGIETSYINLVIAYIVDAGHFWGQTVDPLSTEQQRWMYSTMVDEQYLVPLRDRPDVGGVYAARFTDESHQVQYYRARVEAISTRARNDVAQIFFLDYGNSATVNVGDLRDFGPMMLAEGILQIPAQAFECVMAGIRPSAARNDTGLWSAEANSTFKEMTANRVCYGNVYSVVNGVIHLELLTKQGVSVNEVLVKRELAVVADESFLSQENHKLRVQNLQPFEIKHYNVYQNTHTGETVMEDDIEPPDGDKCVLHHKLRGPSSPLEMQVYSLTRAGQGRDVTICRESVNSVLLDTDPQDPHERLLVAACIGENMAGDRINLRHTTLMPNIHGLAALICLIFTPAMELRTDPKRSRYTGAICGLGINTATGKSMFPDHDMEVNFDTEITPSDVEEINRVRLWMNECLVPDDPDVHVVSDHAVLNAQIRIKASLFKLIQRKQVSCELKMSSRPMSWGLVESKYMMRPSDSDLTLAKQMRAVFRLHWGVCLQPTKEDLVKFNEMLERANELQRLSSGIIESRPSHCLMCNVDLPKRNSIRAHLATSLHREKLRHFKRVLGIDDENQDCR